MADRTRSRRRLTMALAVIPLICASLAPLSGVSTAAAPVLAASPNTGETTPTVPLDENVFFPSERPITECLGVVERPGCGSEARGGTAQTLLAAALFAALGLIGWRIFRGVRRQPG